MTNNQHALLTAAAAVVINFVLYGNLVVAVLGAGTVTYILARIVFWGIDKYQARS